MCLARYCSDLQSQETSSNITKKNRITKMSLMVHKYEAVNEEDRVTIDLIEALPVGLWSGSLTFVCQVEKAAAAAAV